MEKTSRYGCQATESSDPWKMRSEQGESVIAPVVGHGAGERFLGRAKQAPCVGEADSLERPGANWERHAQTKKPRRVQRGCLDYSSARECKENNQGQGKSHPGGLELTA